MSVKLNSVRKIKAIGVVLLSLGLFIFFTVVLFTYIRPKASGIYIETNPASTVFINGEEQGKTPFKSNFPAEEVLVRLVPQHEEISLDPYETKVSLIPGVETVIRRDFAPNQEQASGEIISFEKIDSSETSMSIVTVPDSAQILIDGQDRAYSPFKTSKILPGEHTVVVSARGYTDRVIKVKTHKGYNLTLIVDLAILTEEIQLDNQEDREPRDITQIEILPTGVGFLRVRNEPGTSGFELGRVSPGEVYELIDTDEGNDWFRIEYEEGEFGWISSEYSRIIEESAEDSGSDSESVDTDNSG